MHCDERNPYIVVHFIWYTVDTIFYSPILMLIAEPYDYKSYSLPNTQLSHNDTIEFSFNIFNVTILYIILQ